MMRRSWTAIIVPLLCTALSAQKAPDTQINSSGLGSDPRIAASGSSVYVTWWEVIDYCGYGGCGLPTISSATLFNRSLDGGATWLPNEVRLDAGSNLLGYRYVDGSPQIAASGSSVYVTWADSDRWNFPDIEPDIYFNRSLDGGTTWLPTDVRLDVGSPIGASNSGVPQIAAAGSSVYVTWQDDRNGNSDIYFSRSLDRGATWLPAEVRLDVGSAPGAAYSAAPRIASAGSAVYVAWEDYRNGGLDVYFNRSLDGGTTWMPADARLDVGSAPGAANSIAPEIAALDSAVYVAWADDRSSTGSRADVYFNRSLDRGASWMPVDVLVNVSSRSGFRDALPSISASSSAVFLAWQTDYFCLDCPGDGDVFFNRSLDGGSTWLPADTYLGQCTLDARPVIASSETSVHVTWQQPESCTGFPSYSCSFSDVRFGRSLDDGETWSFARLDVGAPSSTNAISPRVAASGASAYAAWADDRNGPGYAYEIYFNLALGYQPYGQGTPGSGGLVPAIAGSGEASIGGTASIELSNGLGRARGVLAFGSNGPAAIPVDMGLLLLQPIAHLKPFRLGGSPGVPGAGSASVTFEIPDDPSLIGTRVNFQAAIFDPEALGRAALTRGLEMWIL